MVTINQVRHGVEQYMDSEILPKLPPAKAFGVGVYAELLLSQLENQFRQYLAMPAVKMLNLADDNGNIDIDRLREVAQRKMPDRIQLDLPMIGMLTFSRGDIDMLYQHIQRS